MDGSLHKRYLPTISPDSFFQPVISSEGELIDIFCPKVNPNRSREIWPAYTLRAKSNHSGLRSRISATFFARDQFFSCFSRAITLEAVRKFRLVLADTLIEVAGNPYANHARHIAHEVDVSGFVTLSHDDSHISRLRLGQVSG